MSNAERAARNERARRVVGTHSTLSPLERERLPKSVRHCFSGSGQVHYAVFTWDPFDPRKKSRSPFCCGSWRCPGSCARHEASVTFARIKEAVSRPEYDARGWVIAVLTIDREGYYSGERWPDADTAYRQLGRMTGNFLRSIRRYQQKGGWRRVENEWLSVIEAHRTGWPHGNLAFYSPEIADLIDAQKASTLAGLVPREERRLGRALEPNELRRLEQEASLLGSDLTEAEKVLLVQKVRGAKLTAGDRRVWKAIKDLPGAKLLAFAVRAGWGVRSTLERVRDREALSGYVTKLSAEGGQAAGELAKLTQAPRVAPERFRRLRSGVGFLPPRHKSGKTGAIIKRTRDQWGNVLAVPVHSTPPALLAHVAACCEHEEQLAATEDAARRFAKKNPGELALLELAARLQGRALSPEERGLPALRSSFFDERATGPPSIAGPEFAPD